MSIETAGCLEAIERAPDGATVVIRGATWEDYERLLDDIGNRPRLRVTYDHGTIEIMSPLPENEKHIRFLEDVVRFIADELGLTLEKYGSATWKRRRLDIGTEPDACYYVASAPQIIGKRRIDLEQDPPPDVVVEIDVTNESLGKFPLYAALGVPEIWRYDGHTVRFYELSGQTYADVPASRFLTGLTPGILAAALERSQPPAPGVRFAHGFGGQTAALKDFREAWRARA